MAGLHEFQLSDFSFTGGAAVEGNHYSSAITIPGGWVELSQPVKRLRTRCMSSYFSSTKEALYQVQLRPTVLRLVVLQS